MVKKVRPLSAAELDKFWSESYKKIGGKVPANAEWGIPQFKDVLDRIPMDKELYGACLNYPKYLAPIATSSDEYPKQMSNTVRFLKFLHDIVNKGKPLTVNNFGSLPNSGREVINADIVEIQFAKNTLGLANNNKYGAYPSSIAVLNFMRSLKSDDSIGARVNHNGFYEINKSYGIQTTIKPIEGTQQSEMKISLYNDELDEYYKLGWESRYPVPWFDRNKSKDDKQTRKMIRDMSPDEFKKYTERRAILRGSGLIGLYFRVLLSSGQRPDHVSLISSDSILYAEGNDLPEAERAIIDALGNKFRKIGFKVDITEKKKEGTVKKTMAMNILIPEDVFNALYKWSEFVKKEGRTLIFGDYINHDMLQSERRQSFIKMPLNFFPAITGRDRVRRQWNRAIVGVPHMLEDGSMSEGIVPYDLRRTWASVVYTLTDEKNLRQSGGWESELGVNVYATYLETPEAYEIAKYWGIYISRDPAYADKIAAAKKAYVFKKWQGDASIHSVEFSLTGVRPAPGAENIPDYLDIDTMLDPKSKVRANWGLPPESPEVVEMKMAPDNKGGMSLVPVESLGKVVTQSLSLDNVTTYNLFKQNENVLTDMQKMQSNYARDRSILEGRVDVKLDELQILANEIEGKIAKLEDKIAKLTKK